MTGVGRGGEVEVTGAAGSVVAVAAVQVGALAERAGSGRVGHWLSLLGAVM